MSTYSITPATLGDRETVISLYLELLQEMDRFGMDVLPTQENAEKYFDLFFKDGIEANDPILLLRVDGDAVGGIFWPEQRSPFAMRKRVAMGFGVYVREEFQRNGYASKLRKEAKGILRDKGIDFVHGACLFGNAAGRLSAFRDGGREFGQMIEFST